MKQRGQKSSTFGIRTYLTMEALLASHLSEQQQITQAEQCVYSKT